jgi:hypothetical protein
LISVDDRSRTGSLPDSRSPWRVDEVLAELIEYLGMVVEGKYCG